MLGAHSGRLRVEFENDPCREDDEATAGRHHVGLEQELGFRVRSKFRSQFKLCDQEETTLTSLALIFPICKMEGRRANLILL